jgi:hypothetical protein
MLQHAPNVGQPVHRLGEQELRLLALHPHEKVPRLARVARLARDAEHVLPNPSGLAQVGLARRVGNGRNRVGHMRRVLLEPVGVPLPVNHHRDFAQKEGVVCALLVAETHREGLDGFPSPIASIRAR